MLFHLQNYEEYSKTKFKTLNQILLYGSPGTGKTHLVETIAKELELPIIEISAATFNDKYYGESAKRIRRFFEYLEKQEELTTVFIDEIDALAKKRNENTQGEERASLTNLLTEIQKIKDNKKIFIFCATNDFEELDPALRSRFVTAEVKQLSDKDRAQLFKKAFTDAGEIIDDNFATKLAYVTNRKSNEFSEYLTTNLEAFPFDKKFWDGQPSAVQKDIRDFTPGRTQYTNYSYKKIKHLPSRFYFDNRDIGNIAILTLLMQQKCLENYSDTKKCLMCQSAQKAISAVKWVNFDSVWNRWCYNK